MARDDGKALARAGRALGLEAVISLFSGRDIAVDPWRQAAERYQNLTAPPGRESLQPEAMAVGLLAKAICSPDPETARSFASRIPSTSECELYKLVADAIIWDRVTRTDPHIAEPHARLADSLYSLMPNYFQSADNYLAGSLRILSEYIAYFAVTDDVRGKFGEASSLTAGTSHLASQYGIYRYVESAIEIGDRVLEENGGVTGRDAVGFWTIANNLANLYIALAQDQPPASAHQYRKALSYLDGALASLDAAIGEDVPRLREETLRKLVQVHTQLVFDQVEPDEHAAEALRLLGQYSSAALDRAVAEDWAASISAALEADRSEAHDSQYGGSAAALQVESILATERIGEWVQECLGRIVTAQDGSAGRVGIANEVLAALFDELITELDRAVPASGFDWSVCKLLLALGAIASGRLGELTGEIVRAWLTTATVPRDTEPWTPFRARQYLSAGGESQADRTSAVGRIVGLAILADSVESGAPEVQFREMLRPHNAALLKHIIEGRPLFQECSEPALSREADLDALQRACQQIFRAPFVDANRDTPDASTGHSEGQGSADE